MRVLSPAKINLFLNVTGKRSDGYHEIFSLMSCIDLCDVMTFDFGSPDISVRCDSPQVPDNENNLAYKAACLFYDALPRGFEDGRERARHRGVRIFIEKHIPVAAGLGGGSSNAGQTLLHLNEFYGHPFTSRQMHRMALAIGADVPFFLHGKPAIATGIGESLETYHGLSSLSMVLVCPDIAVSTAEVYKNLNLGLTKCEKQLKNFSFKTPKFDVKKHLCNDLETVTTSQYPVITDIKEELIETGADAALMTGSGPAVFGIYSDTSRAIRACDLLSAHDEWRLFTTETLN